ncbi:MAG: hypothetical protein HY559_01435 [Gammaproteobacteria bacterium]|nr:hypothetical protein [Gammaproteobacteria bacterium]
MRKNLNDVSDREKSELAKLSRAFKTLKKRLESIYYEWHISDRNWYFYLPGKTPKLWDYIKIINYRDEDYAVWINRGYAHLQYQKKTDCQVTEERSSFQNYDTSPKAWIMALARIEKQLDKLKGDWVQVNRQIITQIPPELLKGKISRSVILKKVPDLYRPDQELGKAATAKFIDLTEKRTFDESFDGFHPEMTLEKYLDYCKICYLANSKKTAVNADQTGLEMYQQLADGRHEGLIDLPLQSSEAFAKWYASARGGGHPWEICRGGNTTHISLGIRKGHKNWSIYLSAGATSRMVETIRMGLALYHASMPITLLDAESYRLRLSAEDNIGIIPKYDSLHRANQDYLTEEKVYDCLYYSDLGAAKSQLKPFITWEPIPLLVPRS